MPLKNMPIRRKLMAIILVTSGAVLLLTCSAFFAYEFFTFRQGMVRNIAILGEVVATNSTAALDFDNRNDATEILRAVKADSHIVAAALYDRNGKLFSQYPAGLPATALPAAPEPDGYRFARSHLAAFLPVKQGGRRVGTLYLQSDMEAMYERFRLYGGIVALVVAASFLVAYLLSRALQKQISGPILALAETAKAISERQDYSVRATWQGQNELGLLADGFNQMLTRIQERDAGLKERQNQLSIALQESQKAETALRERTAELETANQSLHNEAAERQHAQAELARHREHLEDLVNERTAALRQSETQYRTLFDSIDEGYSVLEMIFDEQEKPVDYRFLELNPSFERQSGLHDARGKRMREFAPNQEAHWFETFGRIAVTGEPARFQNYAEHMQRWYDVYACRFGEPKNRQVAVVFSDITERKTTEANIARLNGDLQQRAAQLEAANKELESFSYSVSHDLRAPLRHVHGYVEMLTAETAGQLSPEAQKHLKVITDASVEMGQLIDDLLAFSRMGRTEVRADSVRLDELVQESIRGLEMATRDRKIVWKIAPLPAVLGDRAMLRQVFANLVGNAVKYSRSRDPAEIEIGCAGEEDGRAVCFVRDNGVGFNMKYLPKLFGVFQRLHKASEFEGTGIGLATVQRIINRHGGRVWAEAALNRGATFYFTLKPAASEPAGNDTNQNL